RSTNNNINNNELVKKKKKKKEIGSIWNTLFNNNYNN
ncbi:hypothetical protein MGQ_01290, partial [Candida albicans P76067]